MIISMNTNNYYTCNRACGAGTQVIDDEVLGRHAMAIISGMIIMISNVYVCTYVRMYVRTYVCMYVRTYVRMYVCV